MQVPFLAHKLPHAAGVAKKKKKKKKKSATEEKSVGGFRETKKDKRNREGGELNWEFGINIHTHYYIKNR